ncbi:hypothetical protein MKK70_22075 [Methylobacterium sp. E-041]|uniref:hypothetical protein n=1 Tax=Methylobacterium sp. E-041 TaxID=2836573 RepID=UPI001FBC113C|nr:hypothetical protein [Methylobacterium sp. E-041]MCJ2108012.1 hypothetical protein [Methylobacterium sp. E-041]
MTQQHVQQMQQQQMPARDHESRIGILENGVAGILSRLENISTKLDNRDKVPWGALIGSALGAITLIVTLISGIGALAFSPLSTGMADLKSAIVKMESRADRYVPREDLDTRFGVITQRRDDLQKASDARVERIERDVDAMQKSIVPRGEHGEVWAGQRVKDEALQRQIDQVRKDVTDLNTPRDTIQGILRRLDELDSRPRDRR